MVRVATLVGCSIALIIATIGWYFALGWLAALVFGWFGITIEAWQGAIIVFLATAVFGGFAASFGKVAGNGVSRWAR